METFECFACKEDKPRAEYGTHYPSGIRKKTCESCCLIRKEARWKHYNRSIPDECPLCETIRPLFMVYKDNLAKRFRDRVDKHMHHRTLANKTKKCRWICRPCWQKAVRKAAKKLLKAKRPRKSRTSVWKNMVARPRLSNMRADGHTSNGQPQNSVSK
jgi:hypothetical protein